MELEEYNGAEKLETRTLVEATLVTIRSMIYMTSLYSLHMKRSPSFIKLG